MPDNAFSALRTSILRTVQRRCPRWHHQRQEDMAHAILLKLLERFDREAILAMEPRFLATVVRNAIVDEWKRKQPEAMDTHDLDELDAHPPTSDRTLRDVIQRALATLSDEQRRAVTLWLLGHSIRETAHLLGWTERQADNHRWRGRKALRARLEAYGVTP
ncbi:MAG: RNA polymerase sigma factor [Acidobacteriota bacterium]